MRRSIFLYSAICIGLVSLAGTYLYVRHVGTTRHPSELVSCFTSGDAKLRTNVDCLKETIHALTDQYATPYILSYLMKSSSPKTIKDNCHVIAHMIGERVYEKTGSVDESLQQCSQQCRSGCLHGVVGAAVIRELGETFPDEDIAHADLSEIKKIGTKYCMRLQLCHGIGHIIYQASAGNLKESLLLCR